MKSIMDTAIELSSKVLGYNGEQQQRNSLDGFSPISVITFFNSLKYKWPDTLKHHVWSSQFF